MSEELKPCPFCGGKVDPTGWLTGYGETGPECEECGATAPTLEIWNNRPRVAELEPELAEAMDILKGLSNWVGGNYRERILAILARHGGQS